MLELLRIRIPKPQVRTEWFVTRPPVPDPVASPDFRGVEQLIPVLEADIRG